MLDRSANSTIRGYLYQFDDTIIRILKSSPRQSILIEGIEDIDIEFGNSCEAIQCKYLPSKRYSLATIRDAILPMLSDFMSRKKQCQREIRYRLYIFFSESNPGNIQLDIVSIKDCLKKKKKNGTIVNFQQEYSASDTDLKRFLGLLSLEIATEYENHKSDTFRIIKQEYNCEISEIELYYNNALSMVAQMASEPEEANRRITKKRFLKNTNNKEMLYGAWRLQEIGKASYCREIRRCNFSVRNIPAHARIFIFEIGDNENISAIKEAVMELRNKWSSHERKRKPSEDRYAPYVLLRGIEGPLLIDIKNELYNEGTVFTDGFAYKGASFNVAELNKQQTYENQLSLRFVNNVDLIPVIINSLTHKMKEVYQFYRTQPIEIGADIKDIQIKINDISYVKEII